MSRDGNAKLTDGVTITQGDRHLSAESANYDAADRRFDVQGDVEYRAPDLRLKGGSGSWNALGTSQFTGAEFELPLRPARGSAETLAMNRAGDLKLETVRFTTCPSATPTGRSARPTSTSTSARSRARAGTSAST
jgi:lipopolysaccharide assembly outer membrane protein LptD (OstA)